MINQSTLQTTSPLKFYLLGAVLFVAIVGTMAAVLLSGRNADVRNQASTSNLCAIAVNVPGSACNQKCGTDEDCMTGMTCYKTTGQTEGLCRNPQNPTNPECVLTPPPATVTPRPSVTPTPSGTPRTTPTPSPLACVQLCTYDYDCAAGYSCVGSNFNNTVDAKETGRRAATATELAKLATDEPIAMGPGNTHTPDSKGVMKFSVIARKQGTFFIKIFQITAPKGKLDPQKQIFSKEFTIAANQVVTGEVYVPRCGRYQVDYGSTMVIGTPYDANPLAHYFWGTVFEIPCQNGCCEPVKSIQTFSAQGTIVPTESITATNASGLSVFKLSALNANNQPIAGLDPLTSGVVINKASNPSIDILAHNFPSEMPTDIASVKFVVDGRQVMVDNSAPFRISGDAGTAWNVTQVPAGTHTLVVTPYTGKGATGTAGKPVTVSIRIQ